MKSVVLYVRESNHVGAKEALEKQKEKLKAFCDQQGYVVADEVSTIGSRKDSLIALKEAIECAKNIEGKTLLMASSNRVVGTLNEVTAVAELLENAGVTIATMDGSFEEVQRCGVSPSMLIATTLSAIDDEFHK